MLLMVLLGLFGEDASPLHRKRWSRHLRFLCGRPWATPSIGPERPRPAECIAPLDRQKRRGLEGTSKTAPLSSPLSVRQECGTAAGRAVRDLLCGDSCALDARPVHAATARLNAPDSRLVRDTTRPDRDRRAARMRALADDGHGTSVGPPSCVLPHPEVEPRVALRLRRCGRFEVRRAKSQSLLKHGPRDAADTAVAQAERDDRHALGVVVREGE